MRGPTSTSIVSLRAKISNGGWSSASPYCASVMPSAWHSRPGPEHNSRSSVTPRRRRIGKSLRRRQGADQHRAGAAVRLAYEVETPVDAVGAIDVGVARWAEHHLVAGGLPDEGMRRRIGVVVGLGLHDDAADALEQQRRADEIGGDDVHAAGEEASAKQAGLGH